MKIETKKLLADVVSACRSIEDFPVGRTLANYGDGDLLRSAGERKSGIGEALGRLLTMEDETFDRVGGAASVLRLRNGDGQESVVSSSVELTASVGT